MEVRPYFIDPLADFCSMALDYEEYGRDWMRIATSLPSDSNYEIVYDSRLKIK